MTLQQKLQLHSIYFIGKMFKTETESEALEPFQTRLFSPIIVVTSEVTKQLHTFILE